MDILPYYPQEFDESCWIEDNYLDPDGVWPKSHGADNSYVGVALTRLLLQSSIIFLLTHSLHLSLRRLNLPRIASEILAGIILGKTVLGRIFGGTKQQLFPNEDILFDTLSKLGFILFMFLAGVKMDPVMVKQAGSKVWTIGLASSTFPIAAATLLSNQFDQNLPVYRRPSAKSIVGVLTSTPFPVIVALLIDLKIINSELGRLSLASTLISDLTSTIYVIFFAIMRIVVAGLSYMLALHSVSLDIVLLGFILLIRPVLLMIIKWTPEGKHVKGVYISCICGVVFASAIVCDNMGLNYQIAPFLIGLTVPDGPPLGSTITDKLETLVSGLLAPLMLTYCAMKIDLLVIYDYKYLQFVWITIFMVVILKFVFILALAILKNVPSRDAITIATIMGTQGLVQAAFYDTFFRNQTIDEETFGAVILSILFIASITHFLVRSLYDYSRTYTGYQKRNIINTSPNSELRILACLHRSDDALAAIRLLETSCPSRESPTAVYALNLVELVGRATPLFINHKFGQKNSSGGSRSQELITLFNKFELQHRGILSIQVYTAVSLPIFMHQDICSLAFDKLTSLIILPFHRKWNQQGKVVYDNNNVRTINHKVLEMAPCSVGIYIDRRKIRQKMEADNDLPQKQQYKVAILFLGGPDDREALAFGKRMMRSDDVHLSVVRLVASDENAGDQWEKVLDAESLKELKYQSSHQNNVSYREERVTEGSETTVIINAMADVFDLIAVGRCHNQNLPMLSGLWEWTDLPELGPVGDILASPDIRKPASVLVVRQQGLN